MKIFSSLATGDLAFALRSLRRTPGFTVVAIVTLALGIGANTSMFSILNGYFLTPAPYPESDRLDRFFRTTPHDARGGFSPADFLDLRAEAGGYGEIAAYASTELSLADATQPPEVAEGLRVSANLFSVLGSEPLIGRGFGEAEEIHGNHRVLVISHRYWQNRFGGDPSVIGRTVRVDGEAHEIIGVLPAEFSDWRHLSWVDVYRPLGFREDERTDRSSAWLRLAGRRGAEVGRGEANAHVAEIGRRLAAEHPTENAEATWRVVPIEETWVVAETRPVFLMLIGLSGFVLLIACSNLANLLLARTLARGREFAVRSALGASRGRLVRPLAFESLLIALGGGACALLVALWTFDWLHAASAADSGVGVALRIDWHVLAWAFGASLLTAFTFGVAPAMFLGRLDPNAALKTTSRGATANRGHQRLRQFLIVGQFTFAMVLLAGAALYARGVDELNNRREGWSSTDLVTGTIVLPSTKYADAQAIVEFHRRALERLDAIPGVADASLSYTMPFFGLAESRKFVAAGLDTPERGREPQAVINGVTPRYFETVGTRLLEGRTFAESDSSDAPRVWIVGESMARGLFGSESAIGRRLAPAAAGGAPAWGTIVGVVADVKGVGSDPSPIAWQLYHPMAQEPRHQSEIAVRTDGAAPAAMIGAIREAFAALDPDLPVRKLRTADEAILRGNYQLGVLRTILGALALLGLGLACLGIYGVIARAMAERTREFGIRLALGARAADITRLVLGSGTRLALVGCTLGLAGAFTMLPILARVSANMEIYDGPVLAGVALLLIAVALLASWLPARNAARINPTETLRAE